MHVLASRLAPLLMCAPRSRVRQVELLTGGYSSPSIAEQAAYIAAFRTRVAALNSAPPPSLPFHIGDERVGYISRRILPVLRTHPTIFHISDDHVSLAPTLVAATVAERSAAIDGVSRKLREAGLVEGWRDELLAMGVAFDAPPLLLIERACAPLFGIKGYGVHVNCYAFEPATGERHLWVSTRSQDKQLWPGMLDHLVAGAQPEGIPPSANVLKEAAEEAGIPRELAATARAAGAVSYCGADEWEQLRRDCLFCYDLELPWEFEPSAVDGEVQSFERWPIRKVADAVAYGNPARCFVFLSLTPIFPYVTPHFHHISPAFVSRCGGVFLSFTPFSPYITPRSSHISPAIS